MSRTPSSEEELFARALLQPAGRCRAFIEEACGADRGLRDRLLALVAAHAGSESLLASAPPVRPGLNEEKPGDTIDRYKLLQKIGEGGCGVVWMAEQEEPVRRRVALKVIKLGMDTKAVVARFEAERQALAMMDHPNIAKVLDGGATHSGRPYFVMELVRGIPITRFCDDHQLPPKGRLELFIQVCQAIQHAHQKGIIHRDIKPSNVLVTLHEKRPVPAVIDFGIAKATQGRLTDATLFTAFDQFLGTPVYTSPEQAENNALDIDTRSDIYSLGVLLYELLTGRPPFDAKAIQQTGLDEFRRMIREVEPPRPSTCVRTLGQVEQRIVSNRRGIPAGQLPAILRGDLDWIVMKALEKNRVRRYQTANAFAMDVQRYLADEPIVARPPGAMYRSVKFIRRHRVAVAAAAAVILALVAGIIASTWQAIRATEAEKAAKRDRAEAVAARTRAEALLDFMLGELRNEVQKVGKLDLLALVGEKATAYFASMDSRELNDNALRQQAQMLRQIGELRVEQARYDEAMESFAASYARTSALVGRRPSDGEVLYDRGQAEYWNGYVHWRRGELRHATEWFTQYRDTALALARIDPARQAWQREITSAYHNLAVLQLERGQLDSAQAGFLAELAAVEKMHAAQPGDLRILFRISDVRSWLGTVAERRGDLAGALDHYAAQTSRLEELVAKEPSTAHWSFRLADSLTLQADILAITGRLAAATGRLTRANAIFEALRQKDPANVRWRATALTARVRAVMIAMVQGDAADAAEALASARTELVQLTAAEPSDRTFIRHLVAASRVEAEVKVALGRHDSLEVLRPALAHADSLVNEARADRKALGESAHAWIVAGQIESGAGRSDAAQRHWQRAWHILEPHLHECSDWRILDPAVRLMHLMGRSDEGAALIARLDQFGYRPVLSWPKPAPALPVSVNP